MDVRLATTNDIDGITALLRQVLEVHAAEYPDIFITGTVKYTPAELKKIILDPETPVFVAENEGKIVGHAFVAAQHKPQSANMYAADILYIDDICVDENTRGMHIGSDLFEYVKNYAKTHGFDTLTLNVWNKNTAAKEFYSRMGLEPLKTMMYTRI